MKAKIFLVIALSRVIMAQSQSLAPVVVASAGGFSSNTNLSLSYTIGEMTMVKTFSSANSVLTQGFQQPNEQLSTSLASTAVEEELLTLFPNPAVDNLWCSYQFNQPGAVNVTLCNELGQQIGRVYEGNTDGGKEVEKLDISKLAAGSYLLRLQFTATNTAQPKFQSKKFIVIR